VAALTTKPQCDAVAFQHCWRARNGFVAWPDVRTPDPHLRQQRGGLGKSQGCCFAAAARLRARRLGAAAQGAQGQYMGWNGRRASAMVHKRHVEGLLAFQRGSGSAPGCRAVSPAVSLCEGDGERCCAAARRPSYEKTLRRNNDVMARAPGSFLRANGRWRRAGGAERARRCAARGGCMRPRHARKLRAPERNSVCSETALSPRAGRP